MILFEAQIKDRYKNYSNINAKVKSEVDSGRVFRLKKGVYTDSQEEEPFLCANAMIQPSYVSFMTALSFYGLIPEATYTITSAITGLGKTKRFESPLGYFVYQNIPTAAFPYGYIWHLGNFNIATPEKALADTLYLEKPVRSVRALRELLFEDLRMEEGEIKQMDAESLMRVLPLYRSANANLMMKLLEAWHGKQTD